MKAASADSHYDNSGITFWFSDDKITVGAVKGGSRNIATVSVSEKPEIALASGTAVNIRCAAIPTYLEGVQVGYTLSVYIGNSEESVITLYVDNKDILTGNYTNIVAQDLGSDFSVEIKTAGEKAHSAEELMAVKIATSTGNTAYKKNKAIIKKSHFVVAGETISEVTVEGDASYNEETGVLTFNKKGTVKLSYTVTNAFGTFKSNVLELTFDDGSETPTESGNDKTPESSGESAKGGCGSSVSGALGILAVLGLAACGVLFREKEQ